MNEVPVEVEGEGDGGDAELAALEADEEMLVVLQPLGDLVHDIGLGAQKPGQVDEALLFAFDAKL